MKRANGENNRLPIFTKQFRELQGERTNTEFADFLGISRQTVGFYCNGDRIPDAQILRDIAKKCNVSSDWLLGLTDIRNPDTNIAFALQYLGLSDSSAKTLLAIKKDIDSEDVPQNAKLLPSTLDKFLSNSNIIILLLRLQSYIDVYKKVISYNEFGFRDEYAKCLEFEGIPIYDFDILRIKFESISDELKRIADQIADDECLQRDCAPQFR